jgi:hypothetical protein
MRISRDQDENLFVYTRVSDATTPSDYADRAADLGISALISGISGALF